MQVGQTDAVADEVIEGGVEDVHVLLEEPVDEQLEAPLREHIEGLLIELLEELLDCEKLEAG